ncbi:MAG: hypothetical protein DME52_09245 [Verrucomicrobia bacterium]|nr:MAG: hypothetical protein DME52_09245 [Verrucomicrobiota bacterium]
MVAEMDTRERKGNGAPRRKLMSTLDSRGRTIWIADAHRGDGKRFVVRADERLIAFVKLESAIITTEKLKAWYPARPERRY